MHIFLKKYLYGLAFLYGSQVVNILKPSCVSVIFMPRSQCRGSLGDQFYFHDVVENIQSGISPPKKKYKESVVTS